MAPGDELVAQWNSVAGGDMFAYEECKLALTLGGRRILDSQVQVEPETKYKVARRVAAD